MSDLVTVELALDISAQVEIATTAPDGFAFGTAVEKAIDVMAAQMRHRFYAEKDKIDAVTRDPTDSRVEAHIRNVRVTTRSVRAFRTGAGGMDK